MKLYLQSIQPDDFMEINQALPLAGIYTTPFDFLGTEKSVREILESLLEVMDDTQKLYVHSISTGFRSMLEEGKRLHALSERIVMVVPCDAQGLMALKACRTLKIPAALGSIFDAGQAAAAASVVCTGSENTVFDLSSIARHGDGQALVSRAAELLADTPEALMVTGCLNQEAFAQAAVCHPGSIAAGADVYRSMLYSVLTQTEMETIREQWIMTYTSDMVLD